MEDLVKIGIPPLYRSVKLASLLKLQPLLEYKSTIASFFKGETLGLLLAGINGCGKTTTACAIAMELYNRGISVIRADLDTIIQDTIQNNFLVPKKYMQPKVLIIEELGKELNKTMSQHLLEKIVRWRIEQKKQTTLSSNVGSDRLESLYGTSLISLMSGHFTVVSFPNVDNRKNSKKLS